VGNHKVISVRLFGVRAEVAIISTIQVIAWTTFSGSSNWRRTIFFPSRLILISSADWLNFHYAWPINTQLKLKYCGMYMKFPVAVRSKAAWLQGSRVRILLRLRMFVSCVCSVLCIRRFLRRPDHLFREILSCVCESTCVWSRNLKLKWSRPDLGCCNIKNISNWRQRILIWMRVFLCQYMNAFQAAERWSQVEPGKIWRLHNPG
jgi:hypothetical protein